MEFFPTDYICQKLCTSGYSVFDKIVLQTTFNSKLGRKKLPQPIMKPSTLKLLSLVGKKKADVVAVKVESGVFSSSLAALRSSKLVVVRFVVSKVFATSVSDETASTASPTSSTIEFEAFFWVATKGLTEAAESRPTTLRLT